MSEERAMSPALPAMEAAPARPGVAVSFRSSPTDPPSLDELGAESDRPEVQQIIREGIRRGTLRVVPIPGCMDRVKVIRNHNPAPDKPAL
jgi:hypothetical protein